MLARSSKLVSVRSFAPSWASAVAADRRNVMRMPTLAARSLRGAGPGGTVASITHLRLHIEILQPVQRPGSASHSGRRTTQAPSAESAFFFNLRNGYLRATYGGRRVVDLGH